MVLLKCGLYRIFRSKKPMTTHFSLFGEWVFYLACILKNIYIIDNLYIYDLKNVTVFQPQLFIEGNRFHFCKKGS